jgi:cardiolipin synthase
LVTLPNILSMARFPMAAAFVAIESIPWRVVLLGAASVSDFLDGWLARRGRTTPLGALLDPIADKTFVVAALTAFVLDRSLSLRAYLLVLSRDWATILGFLVASLVPGVDVRRFKARWPGKVVTVLQLLVLLSLLLMPAFFSVLLPLVVVVSAWAIADYGIVLYRSRARS